MTEVENADPVYCRGVILLDEIDKALRSDISNPSTAIDKLSEVFESSCPVKKRKDAKQLRFGNFVIFLGANFFTNVRTTKTAKIGFDIPDESSNELGSNASDIEPIDKEEIRRKLGEYLTVSSINRFDDILLFENAFPEDVTKKILCEHFESISDDIWMRFRAFDPKGQILPPSFAKPKPDTYLDEVYTHADKQGGIRSLKRTLELRIKSKIMEFYLKQLTPENQYIFLQAQHAEVIRIDLNRFNNAKKLADDDEDYFQEIPDSFNS